MTQICKDKKKKCTKLWVKLYLGQREDYSPGNSISDSSEELLQRGKGEGQYICDFGEGGYGAVKHTFWQRVATSYNEVAASQQILMILVLDMRRCKKLGICVCVFVCVCVYQIFFIFHL